MPGWKILVVEPDPQMLDTLVAALVGRFNAHITCVADAQSCLDVETVDPHDLVVSELSLAGVSGLDLARRLVAIGNRPVMLLAHDPTCEDAIEAMRAGVRDLLRKPFVIEELLETAEHLLRAYELRRQYALRHRRMRHLLRRVIRERRDLNHRVELICRDLVGAHRQLVHRVLAIEAVKPKPSA